MRSFKIRGRMIVIMSKVEVARLRPKIYDLAKEDTDSYDGSITELLRHLMKD